MHTRYTIRHAPPLPAPPSLRLWGHPAAGPVAVPAGVGPGRRRVCQPRPARPPAIGAPTPFLGHQRFAFLCGVLSIFFFGSGNQNITAFWEKTTSRRNVFSRRQPAGSDLPWAATALRPAGTAPARRRPRSRWRWMTAPGPGPLPAQPDRQHGAPTMAGLLSDTDTFRSLV